MAVVIVISTVPAACAGAVTVSEVAAPVKGEAVPAHCHGKAKEVAICRGGVDEGLRRDIEAANLRIHV